MASVDLLLDGEQLGEALQSPVEQRGEDKELRDKDADGDGRQASWQRRTVLRPHPDRLTPDTLVSRLLMSPAQHLPRLFTLTLFLQANLLLRS